jgi:threonine/homoserine/homoserine lactone efflux protein
MQVNIFDAIFKGVLIGLFMAISVGPTLFAVIRYSISYNHKSGMAFVLGVSVSDITFVTLSNIAAGWLALLRPYERAIGLGGGMVLMAMGLMGFFRKHAIPAADGTISVPRGHYFRIWLSGFLVNTLNPGAIITWLGAVTIIADTSATYRIILFATCLAIILSIDFSKVFLAKRIKKYLTHRRIGHVQKFSGICLFTIGLSIFITTFFNVQHSGGNEKNSIDKILSGKQAHL